MKKVLLAVVTFLVSVAATATATATATAAAAGSQVLCEGGVIYGTWKWHQYIYEGQKLPLSNPNLNLIFEFFPGGQNRLYWDRKGEPGFCERRGEFTFSQCQLNDHVVWVNPKNAIDCSLDPDMEEGRRTQTKVEVRGDEVYFYLSLGGEPFIYIWRKQK